MAGRSLSAGIAMGRTSPNVLLGITNPLACHLCGGQQTCLITAIAILALIWYIRIPEDPGEVLAIVIGQLIIAPFSAILSLSRN